MPSTQDEQTFAGNPSWVWIGVGISVVLMVLILRFGLPEISVSQRKNRQVHLRSGVEVEVPRDAPMRFRFASVGHPRFFARHDLRDVLLVQPLAA